MNASTNRTLVRALVLGAAVMAVAGCTRGTSDLQNWIADVKAQPPPPLEPIPVMQQFETFEYAAQDLRDPFSPPLAQRDGGGDGPRPDPDRRREELEAFPLDSLRMSGTLGPTDGDVRALVMAPDRVVHRVRVGNYLGQNEGRITAVHPDRIELVELVTDGAGGWLERRASIALED
ncbi:MAG: pilus assembly protein PilP [Lysobacteraceae bacterium]